MDFEYHYSPVQEVFRKEVRSWMEANAPRDLSPAQDAKHTDAETWRRVREFRRKLAGKGWLHPTYPTQYGGGGLTPEHARVIAEELERVDIAMAGGGRLHDNTLDIPALMVWGTEDQKQRLLKPRLRGERFGWQLFTEPEAGSDLASLKTRAVRDGDDWVITGEKVFVGGDAGYADPSTKVPDEEQLRDLDLFCLAVTDPNAPRHHNIGYFMIPGDTPGLTVQTLDLLVGHGKRQVYLDNVRIPSWRLIGGEAQGWQVAQTTLEIEHGAEGSVTAREKAVDEFTAFVRQTGLGQDPQVQQLVVQAVIDSEIMRLFSTRNYWLYSTRQEITYEGSQLSLWRKESSLRIADAIREVMGPHTLLDFEDPLAPAGGLLELYQRESLARAHPGGTVEVQKVIMARRMGVSRTKERAAPTPATTAASR